MKRYSTRLHAAEAAKQAGVINFRTFLEHHNGPHYFYRDVSGPTIKPEIVTWAEGLEYVSWVETSFKDGGRIPGFKSIAYVTVRLEEIPVEDLARIEDSKNEEHPIELMPITPSLWDTRDKGGVSSPTRGHKRSGEGQAQRDKSSAESPVKIVWEVADSMPKATRQEVVAACVERGVNAATASTQYYRWVKAKKNK